MADNITCNVCAGTSFHKESGFYYCNECQTQSQDIQERVFAIEEEDVTQPIAKVRSSKRIRSAKKADSPLTSWECYNYIIIGLVDELIKLGADVALKKTVRVLWFRYLNKLEVTSSSNEFPKLSAVNSKIDAEIIYGRSRKRKRNNAKRTPSPSSSSEALTDSSMSRRERSKKRRNLVLAEYDDFSATLLSEDVSLHNQSLISLKSSEASSKDAEKFLQYNKYARKELLKHMSKNHLKDHIQDIHSTRVCHQSSYKSLSSWHTEGPAVLSRIKIYALLYLGLLINKDNIQLGDLIRFIREGHLSYHRVIHFFPEDLHEKLVSIKSWNEKQSIFCHNRMRKITAQLAHFLGVTSYVPIQNLLNLCRRYCNELNLPDEVWVYSINLMARIVPRMKFTTRLHMIPNYEGRVLSIMIFVLKLMLGLDGETEQHFSNLAKEINKCSKNIVTEKMFSWNDWIYHIHYRKLLLMQHHFPTNYLFDDDNAIPEVATSFLYDDFLKIETDVKLNRESEIIKSLLEKFRDRHCELPKRLTFESTLTPFRSNIETLIKSKVIKEEQGCLMDVLQLNFSSDSFKFVINPFQYLDELHKDCKVSLKHRGVNNRLKIVQFKNLATERCLWRKHVKRDMLVNICSKTSSDDNNIVHKYFSNLEDAATERNSKDILKNFYALNTASFAKHKNHLIKSFKKQRNVLNTENSLLTDASFLNSTQSTSSKNSTLFHYNSYERYWLKNLNVNSISIKEFQKFFQTFPKSFQDVLRECARITEQDTKELYDEFNDVEIYLCYVAKFSILDKHRNKIANKELKHLIAKATKTW